MHHVALPPQLNACDFTPDKSKQEPRITVINSPSYSSLLPFTSAFNFICPSCMLGGEAWKANVKRMCRVEIKATVIWRLRTGCVGNCMWMESLRTCHQNSTAPMQEQPRSYQSGNKDDRNAASLACYLKWLTVKRCDEILKGCIKNIMDSRYLPQQRHWFLTVRNTEQGLVQAFWSEVLFSTLLTTIKSSWNFLSFLLFC